MKELKKYHLLQVKEKLKRQKSINELNCDVEMHSLSMPAAQVVGVASFYTKPFEKRLTKTSNLNGNVFFRI